jgi:putative salt-induced outer membrane protein YdiY
VNAFRDLRLLNEVSASVDIDKRFSAKVLSQLHYNSTPPSGVKPLDVDTLTSLVLTL